MANQPIVVADNLCKSYRIYRRPGDYLKELLLRRSCADVFWALRDVSFSLQNGQRLGVIGANGSGKSTLLRILTGNLEPTAGSVSVHGQVSAMLSLNSCFSPDESGYKNAHLNLLIYGCPPDRIQEKIEDIVDFAELGPFIYKPVKTYSTGMVARLSFAITTALDPDILVIDEVLSVGDAYFNAKAMQRMQSVCDRGRALIFVSHSLSDVCRLCNVAMWLDHGQVRAFGPVHDVTRQYEQDARRQEDMLLREQNRALAAQQIIDQTTVASLSPDHDRLRLCSTHRSGCLTGVHYVRKITAQRPGAPPTDVDLGSKPVDGSDSWIWPDTLSCEWGRVHQHLDSECRLLYPQTGRQRGGLLVVSRPASLKADWPLELTFETKSDDAKEKLTLQLLDVAGQQWVDAQLLNRELLKGGWERVRCRSVLKHRTAETYAAQRARLHEQSRPLVEILASEIWSEGRAQYVIDEGRTFEIRVTIQARKRVPRVDVGVKLTRFDGTYVFWQSSGQGGQNLLDFEGTAVVVFSFEPNFLGAGEFLLTVGCHDGWDLGNNYPYAQVFDRRVNACTFSVRRQDPRLDRGVINVDVPVKVIREPLVQAA
jgi:lipopolysaccharide transport system ATP-binding protein